MTRLILLAHAETAATRSSSFPRDEPLTERGRADTERVRPDLPRFGQVWRSPAAAARDTADALQAGAMIEPALADLDVNGWRGLTIQEQAAANPAALRQWLEDPTFAGHGGESVAALLGRVTAWLENRLGEPGVSLAISHAAILRCAVLATLDAPAGSFWSVDIAPLTRVELSSDGRRWNLRQIVKHP